MKENCMDMTRICRHFGFVDDPFDELTTSHIYRDEKFHRRLNTITNWLKKGKMCAMIGDIGDGKTTTIRALREAGRKRGDMVVAVVRVPDGKYAQVNSIIYPAIAEACREHNIAVPPVPHKRYDKANYWMKSIIGISNPDKHFIIVLDEAHTLPGSFLKSMKLISEIDFADGLLPLGILFSGQRPLRAHMEQFAPDIWHRISVGRKLISLDRPSSGEVEKYLTHRLAQAGCRRVVFDKSACNVIARLANTWIRVNDYAMRGLEAAHAAGKKQVSGKMLLTSMTLEDKFLAAAEQGITLREIAERSGTSPASTSAIKKGIYSGDVQRMEGKYHATLDTMLGQSGEHQKTA